jgi:hypothetical protein
MDHNTPWPQALSQTIPEAWVSVLRPVMNYNTSGSQTTVWNMFWSLGQRSKAMDGSQYFWVLDHCPEHFPKPSSEI